MKRVRVVYRFRSRLVFAWGGRDEARPYKHLEEWRVFAFLT